MLIVLLSAFAMMILVSAFFAGYRCGERYAMSESVDIQESAEVVKLERYATSLEDERDRLQAILKAGREVQ